MTTETLAQTQHTAPNSQPESHNAPSIQNSEPSTQNSLPTPSVPLCPSASVPSSNPFFERPIGLVFADLIERKYFDHYFCDLKITRDQLREFLSSKQCNEELELRDALIAFQLRVHAQDFAQLAFLTLREVTNSKNPIAKRLAAQNLLERAGIHPEKPPTIVRHESTTGRFLPNNPQAGSPPFSTARANDCVPTIDVRTLEGPPSDDAINNPPTPSVPLCPSAFVPSLRRSVAASLRRFNLNSLLLFLLILTQLPQFMSSSVAQSLPKIPSSLRRNGGGAASSLSSVPGAQGSPESFFHFRQLISGHFPSIMPSNLLPKGPRMFKPLPITAAVLTLAALMPFPASAADQTPAERKAVDYLLTQQDKNGAWLPQVGPAVTAMVVKGLVQAGRTTDDPAVKKGLEFIESCHQKDGGYYKDSNPNYNSSIVLSMFSELSEREMEGKVWRGPRPYSQQITGLQTFLKGLQQLEPKKDSHGNAITQANSWYGGAGYGEDRPDLSNTAFFIEALHDSGLPGSDPAIQKALVFVSRSQMNGETNDQAFAKGATDGGFIYTPVESGDSKFGDIDNLEGGSQLRSYGSMTYSGFKSLLYAGLTESDPRVKAAIKWISNNWTLEYNPGSGGSADGQYYYLHAFARAMHAYNHDQITDGKGVKHNWKTELTDFLAAHQKADGSWVNEKSPRWLEGNPVLATAYSVLALEEARK